MVVNGARRSMNDPSNIQMALGGSKNIALATFPFFMKKILAMPSIGEESVNTKFR